MRNLEKKLIHMVRCSKCTKSFKQHYGECWDDGMCRKCWSKPREQTLDLPKINTRLTNTPMDFYLDLYVMREVLTIDN